MIIEISSVRFSCCSHSLYDSPAIAAQASRGSEYLAAYMTTKVKKTHKGKEQSIQKFFQHEYEFQEPENY